MSVEAALGLARKHNEPRLLAQSLIHRGGVRSLLGEQAAALSDFLEAQRVFTNAGLKKEAEASLQDIAIAYRRMGDHDKAMDYLRQSIAFAERERYWGVLSVSLLQIAFPARRSRSLRRGAGDATARAAGRLRAWPGIRRGCGLPRQCLHAGEARRL